MPTSIRAHLATQPDSASLESLAISADHAVAAENDVDEAKLGVAEIQENRATKTPFVPNVQAKQFVPNNQNVNRQGVFTNTKQDSCPNAAPPHTQQNNAAQPIDTADAPVCFYHQTFGDKARTCTEPCAFS